MKALLVVIAIGAGPDKIIQFEETSSMEVCRTARDIVMETLQSYPRYKVECRSLE